MKHIAESFPEQWLFDGSEKPTSQCIYLAKTVVDHLEQYNLQPHYIAPSVENGIYIKYLYNQKQLEIEVYNDLEIAAIVSIGSRVLFAEDIQHLDFTDSVHVLKEQ